MPYFLGITVNAFNPGLMAGTGLNRGAPPLSAFIWKYVLPPLRRVIPGSYSVDESAVTLAALSLDQRYAGVTGQYFGTRCKEQASSQAHDPSLARELWQSSVDLSQMLEEERLL